MGETSAFEAVQRTASEYARLYNDRRIDDLAGIFTTDTRVHINDRGRSFPDAIKGRRQLLAFYRAIERHPAQASASFDADSVGGITHAMVNPYIEIDGDVALASFDFFTVGLVNGELTVSVWGRYDFDKIVREPDRWRIAELTITTKANIFFDEHTVPALLERIDQEEP